MRKSDLKANHYYFDKALSRYRAFTRKIIAAKRVIADAQEKQDIAESVLLRLVANWEYFVDEHLVACVNRDHSKMKDFLGVSIPNHPNLDLCRALLFGDGYRSFSETSFLVSLSMAGSRPSGSLYKFIADGARTRTVRASISLRVRVSRSRSK